MIISGDGRNLGTIGGGMLEARVIQKAAEVLSARRPRIMAFNMQPSDMAAMDMICGGALEVLLKQGFTAADLKRVHAPTGLPIEAQTPEEIALSIVAEMVKVRGEGRCA
jgi:xanthine/CO dehydrogenase XdhC/CoxF family maturation factor